MILLHGLWMSGWVMVPLRRMIASQGFRTSLFSYPTVRQGLDENAMRLARHCLDQPGDVLHLVGHSLGGLVALRMAALCPDPRPGRIVLLGTPLGGSVSARRLMAHAFGRSLIGRSLPAWRPDAMPAGRDIGMIAGVSGAGVGRMLGPLQRPNDGTVTVSETCDSRLTDHRCLPVTHTSMLVSRRVGAETCHFLRHGCFTPAARDTR